MTKAEQKRRTKERKEERQAKARAQDFTPAIYWLEVKEG